MADIKEKLKSYRTDNNLTQEAMADLLDIKYRTYQSIEGTGEVKKIADMNKINAIIGVEIDRDFTGKDDNLKPMTIDPFVLINKLIDQNEVLVSAIAQSVSNEKETLITIKQMSESNAEMSKSILNSNVQPGNPATGRSMQDDFLLLLGNRFLGKKFETLDEVFLALHKPATGSRENNKSTSK